MMHPLRLAALLAAGSTALAIAPAAHAVAVKISVENVAPMGATSHTPVWIGLHDGTFDLFNPGEAASMPLERVAEDGNPGPLNALFSTAQPGGHQDVIFGPGIGPGSPPIFGPGGRGSAVLDLGPGPTDFWLSFASMVLPSNDAFFANENPLAYKIVDGGSVIATTILVLGSQVWDAGTEVNDEIPQNVPLLGQMADNTGVVEGGDVAPHAGFIPGGPILSAFPNGDFTQNDYQVARITISQVPEPPTLALLAGSLGMGVWLRRRRKADRAM